MDCILWRDEYSVNVKLIDDQHKHFIDILNEVIGCIPPAHGEKNLGLLIEQLSEHIDVHFETEESYFDQFHCTNIEEEEHRKRHQEFRERVADLKQRYADGQTDLVMEIVSMMGDWIVHHIMTYDKRYVSCFNEHGVR